MSFVSHSKRIDAELNARFGARLKAWVDATCDGNQSEAGRKLGCSQSHISALLSGERGVGLPFLLLFAAETGESLDDLLGMRRDDEHFRRMLREELAALRETIKTNKDQPHAKPLRGRPAARRVHE